MPPRSREEFEIAIVCALPLEADAVEALFDENYDELGYTYGKQAGDFNSYATGRINNQDVVLVYTPGMGNRRSAGVARSLHISFTGIKLTLVVGICGGAPYSPDGTEIILGDIIISDSVIEYDFGRHYPHGFERKSGVKEVLGPPNQAIQSSLNRLRTRRRKDRVQRQTVQYLKTLQETKGNKWNYPGVPQDRLFEASCRHKHHGQQYTAECICAKCHSSFHPVCQQALKDDCKKIGCAGNLVQRRRLMTDNSAPIIHIGTITSANSVMKSGELRDQLVEKEDVIGFEMEGAGVWDSLPCLIIKGVCDYADSHKNKAWQNYAAATAASCTIAFLKDWNSPVQESQASRHLTASSMVPLKSDELFVGWEDIMTTYFSQSSSPRQQQVVKDTGRLRTISEDLHVFLQVLHFLKISFPNPDDCGTTSVPEPVTELLRKHYTRFSYISSLCLATLFKELLRLFGIHFVLFFHILKQCGSQVPKLLVGADIVFEDVFGEEIRLPYRKYRHWDNFNSFLLTRFLAGQAEQYVATGKFQLYDYQGSSLIKDRWQKLVPNSKVIMSVIIQLSEHNVCGRCFKKEDTSESGIVKCSNCGLMYSRIGLSTIRVKPTTSKIRETTEEDEFSAQKSEHSGRRIPRGEISSQSNSDGTISSALGYNCELENFARIDFEVMMTSEPISFVIIQVAELIKFLFTLVEQQGHRSPNSSVQLSDFQSTLRSCYSKVEDLLTDRCFDELDNDLSISAGYSGDEACFEVRKIRVKIRYEVTTMYRKILSDGFFIIPENLGGLLASCGDCVKRLRALLHAGERDGYEIGQLTSYWSGPEVRDFPILLAHFGMDYEGIAGFMKSKTATMVRNYYQRKLDKGNYKVEEIVNVAEVKKMRGEPTRPFPTPHSARRGRYEAYLNTPDAPALRLEPLFPVRTKSGRIQMPPWSV